MKLVWAFAHVANKCNRFLSIKMSLSSFSKKTIGGYELRVTQHAKRMAQRKNFSLELLHATFAQPVQVYASRSHPGQYRVTGNGICLVGEPCDATHSFTLVTVYADQILTPPRPDQLATAEGRRFAERFARGLGRES